MNYSSYNLLTSFTSTGINCMPMWAHYANNHQGYCVVYDTTVKENITLRGTMLPVQYTDKRIDITSIMIELIEEIEAAKKEAIKNNSRKIIINNTTIVWLSIYYSCLKHISWSYEQELRAIIGKQDSKFLDALPTGIYVGAKCSQDNTSELICISKELKIPIYKMFFDEYSLKYELSVTNI